MTALKRNSFRLSGVSFSDFSILHFGLSVYTFRMPTIAIIIGVVLDLLALFGYFGTGAKSVTALIPGIFGTIILVCGVVAKWKESLRRHVMHVAALVSLLGCVGAFMRVGRKFMTVLMGQPVLPSATAVWLQITFGLVCLIFFLLCICSFLRARLRRAQAYK